MTVNPLLNLQGPLTRSVYFSFHYGNDKGRAEAIKQAWDLPGFRNSVLRVRDGSLEELAKKESDLAIKRAINAGMFGNSVCCLLVGSETWTRKWCRYEVFNALHNEKGLLGVYVDRISNNPFANALAGPAPPANGMVRGLSGTPNPFGTLSAALGNPPPRLATLLTGEARGPNPLERWGYARPVGHSKFKPCFFNGTRWVYCDFCDDLTIDPPKGHPAEQNVVYRLSSTWPIYDWADGGQENMPEWVHAAAQQARR